MGLSAHPENMKSMVGRASVPAAFGGTGVSPVQAQAKPPWPFGTTPNPESLCRGGFKTRPYTWTFTVKSAATGKFTFLNATQY